MRASLRINLLHCDLELTCAIWPLLQSADGERLPLAVKDLGSSDIYPQSLEVRRVEAAGAADRWLLFTVCVSATKLACLTNCCEGEHWGSPLAA
jgi:hypothetical protein